RRRERGRIPVKGVRLVEVATVNGEGGDPFAPDGYPFQVGYCESTDDQSQRTVPQYTLYLVANSEKERHDWIRAIRQVCEDTNTPKSYRFHPGLWSGKRWSCCKGISRATFGCQAATHWRETNNNPNNSFQTDVEAKQLMHSFIDTSLSEDKYGTQYIHMYELKLLDEGEHRANTNTTLEAGSAQQAFAMSVEEKDTLLDIAEKTI
ncbi:tyrosine-protein kinase Btk-like, partial [Musca vetustissima]|uniref:tyrosine-protein kinase Btk-like n=1 Tax=Musca vetustissima TaxID=27455 RepID=UPI002AB63EEF